MLGYRINDNGYFFEYAYLNGDEIPSDCITQPIKGGLIKPKWNGTSWEEGASQEEIETIKNTQPLSELDQLKKQQADLVFQLMISGVL